MTFSEQSGATPRRFKNPPIVEAVIAVNIPELSISVLGQFHSMISSLADAGYLMQAPVTKHDFQISVEKGQSRTQIEDALVGYRFIDLNHKFSFQFLRTGFVFSQRGKYESWEIFTAEAKRIWDRFIHIVGSVEPISFQVRYINKLFLPVGRRLEDFLKLYTFLAPDLPQVIYNQLLRLTLPIENPQGVLNHTQAFLAPEKEGFLTLLLDNDFTFPLIGTPLSALWIKIDGVRNVKDEIFLQMLTDEMKETFDA